MGSLNIVTADELETFKQDLLCSIERKLEQVSHSGFSKRWLRTHEVAEYLSLSKTQVNILKANGKISANKLGGTNYYDRQHIDQLLSNPANLPHG